MLNIKKKWVLLGEKKGGSRVKRRERGSFCFGHFREEERAEKKGCFDFKKKGKCCCLSFEERVEIEKKKIGRAHSELQSLV